MQPAVKRVHVDFETRSAAELKTTGAYAYAQHPSTEVYWLCYALDSEPVRSWRPGMVAPDGLLDAIRGGAVVVAHNASFEWCIWNLCLRGKYGLDWPELTAPMLDDTMSRGLVMALPAGLGDMAAAVGVAFQKDAVGKRLMLQMSKPIPRLLKKGEIAYYDDEERRERLRQYCVLDVETERALDHVLPPLSPEQRKLWELDHKINVRGIAIDVDAARRAQAIVRNEMETANAQISLITGEQVETVNSHAKLGGWLRGRGVAADNTQAETIELLLEGEHPRDVQRVLELRRDSGKSSVTKLPALIGHAANDNRAHFLLMFAGAGRTLRWAGRGPQPQNLPRPDFKQHEIESVLRALGRPNAAQLIDAVYGAPVSVLSSCLRALFVAAPGLILTAADLANIEGRVAAWIAGEEWKLEAFRAFDAKRGPDLYKVAYARTFGGRAEDVSDDGYDRQIGKIMELFLQYQGGEGAFATGANTYGFDILKWGQEPRKGRRSIPADIVPTAIKGWRDAHPKIKDFWYDLQNCALDACRDPGRVYWTQNGAISFERRRKFLVMTLPNGRPIYYFDAHIAPGKFGDALYYYGVDSKTHTWCLQSTYGGKLFENCLGGKTKVLSSRGWIELRTLSKTDRVWDGVAFVSHGGVVSNGLQPVGEIDGITLTADHRLLSNSGWENASSCGGLDRAKVQLPYGYSVRRFRRPKVVVAGALRLRARENDSRNGTEETEHKVVRVQVESAHRCREHETRSVQTPGIRRLGEHGCAVRPADASGVEKLRRPGHNSLRRMARLRSVLAGYGSRICSRVDARSREQLGGLQLGKLPVGDPENTRPQHSAECAHTDPRGRGDYRRSVGGIRHRQNNIALPPKAGRKQFGVFTCTGRSEQVYDIVNCGPRNRFVVMSDAGPVIAHNCVQALARDIFGAGLLRAEKANMPIVLHIHDAAVTEHKPGEYTAADLSRVLCDVGPTYTGLPVSAKGYSGSRFQK